MNNCLIREVIKKSNCKIKKCKILNNAIIYEDCNGNKFVAKQNKENNVIDTYNYLNSRGFNYLPKIIYKDDNGYIYRYEENLDIPGDEKISDIVKMISLLHNKTAYYIDNSSICKIKLHRFTKFFCRRRIMRTIYQKKWFFSYHLKPCTPLCLS